jgi:hypothetical protein
VGNDDSMIKNSQNLHLRFIWRAVALNIKLKKILNGGNPLLRLWIKVH